MVTEGAGVILGQTNLRQFDRTRVGLRELVVNRMTEGQGQKRVGYDQMMTG